jgi:hypothetical protein
MIEQTPENIKEMMDQISSGETLIGLIAWASYNGDVFDGTTGSTKTYLERNLEGWRKLTGEERHRWAKVEGAENRLALLMVPTKIVNSLKTQLESGGGCGCEACTYVEMLIMVHFAAQQIELKEQTKSSSNAHRN